MFGINLFTNISPYLLFKQSLKSWCVSIQPPLRYVLMRLKVHLLTPFITVIIRVFSTQTTAKVKQILLSSQFNELAEKTVPCFTNWMSAKYLSRKLIAHSIWTLLELRINLIWISFMISSKLKSVLLLSFRNQIAV